MCRTLIGWHLAEPGGHTNTNVWQANSGLDAIPTDSGTPDPALQRNGALGVFRAASLRYIAATAPYMHDGRFANAFLTESEFSDPFPP